MLSINVFKVGCLEVECRKELSDWQVSSGEAVNRSILSSQLLDEDKTGSALSDIVGLCQVRCRAT